MRTPALSVVVPTLDESAFLPALLDSLARCGEQAPEETIVVDGGSADDTLEIARRAGARTIRAPRGRGGQLRRGALAATGDVLLFLHADVRVEAGSLAAVRAAFRDPDVIATGMRQRIDGDGLLYRLIERTADLRVRGGWVYGDSGLAVRRADYERVGGFAELPLFEDLDLSRRLRRRGRVRLLRDAELAVSARRWQRDGVLRRTCVNWLLTAAWLAGVAPSRLVRYYPPARGAARQ